MQDKKMPKVQVHNLTKKFGDLLVLNDISFDVRSGEFLCIVGPTGCGKTTFLNSLTKLYEPTAGEILLDGEPVNLKKHNIAYIFQEYSTMPWLTVEENVGFGLDIKGVEKEKAKALVDEYLDIVGLTKYRKYYPDEPYGQLDIQLRYHLEDELISLWQRTGTTVIFITHNIEEAVYMGERILVLTNKPTSIKCAIDNNLPRPRDIASPDFVKLRNEVTDLIKWW